MQPRQPPPGEYDLAAALHHNPYPGTSQPAPPPPPPQQLDYQDIHQPHMVAHTRYQPPQPQFSQGSSFLATRESFSGPSRPSQNGGGGSTQRGSYSTGGGFGGATSGGGGGASAPVAQGGSGGRSGPYTRPPDHLRDEHSTTTVKASSTTSEFTKRKNWSQHIVDEIQDFMHVLAPNGNIMFVSPSTRDLTGWAPEEVVSRSIIDFVHPDDVDGFLRDFNAALAEGSQLNLYYRFRTKDDGYAIFEVAGHAYYVEENGTSVCKCFFGMGRPYPSKNTAMLDSLLELKMENERLRQELQHMYKDIEGGQYGYSRDRRPAVEPPAPQSPEAYSHQHAGGVIDHATGLVQVGGLLPSSSNMYGALGIGISAAGTKESGSGDKKKKKVKVEDGEFVCRDCGTVDSPEWRKGPEGPKSLCNACGLRYAKLKSKEREKAKLKTDVK